MNRSALGTNLTICGCATQFSPPVAFPPPETPDECLATSSNTYLQRRSLVFLAKLESYQFTCSIDINKNPYQDCFNMMAKICNPKEMGTDSNLLARCKAVINQMAQSTSRWWQEVGKACGQWTWSDGTVGDVNSPKCNDANLALQKNAFYIVGGVKIPVPPSLTNSINKGLWSNPLLK
jgi:hypothetical protein